MSTSGDTIEDLDYTYDDLGRVTEIKDAGGNSVYYEYDSQDRLTKQSNTFGAVEKYLYVEDCKGVTVYQPHETLRKQYLRYKLSESLGVNDRWDWVKEQNWPLIERTILTLKPYFI